MAEGIVEPNDRARARFAVARALWETKGEQSRAIELAREARGFYEARGMKPWQQRVDAWLGARVDGKPSKQ